MTSRSSSQALPNDIFWFAIDELLSGLLEQGPKYIDIPKDANPTNANPTNANPTNANPTNANPTNANPTNANPKSANPIGTRPTGAHPTPNYLQPGLRETLFYCHKTARNSVIARIFLRHGHHEPFPVALSSKDVQRSKALFEANLQALRTAAEECGNEIGAGELRAGRPEQPEDTKWYHLIVEKDIELDHETFGEAGEGAPPVPRFRVTAIFRVDIMRIFFEDMRMQLELHQLGTSGLVSNGIADGSSNGMMNDDHNGDSHSASRSRPRSRTI